MAGVHDIARRVVYRVQSGGRVCIALYGVHGVAASILVFFSEGVLSGVLGFFFFQHRSDGSSILS